MSPCTDCVGAVVPPAPGSVAETMRLMTDGVVGWAEVVATTAVELANSRDARSPLGRGGATRAAHNG